MSEKVLVFSEKDLEKCSFVNSFWLNNDGCVDNFIKETKTEYVDRGPAETDTTKKQLIPYIVIRKIHDNKLKILAYQRTKKSGENRLHDNWSIGIGGHINPVDSEVENSFENGMYRELSEEVGLNKEDVNIEVVGAIYDDSNDVGKVHFGVAIIADIYPNTWIEIKDEALDNACFLTVEELKEKNLENWSKIFLENL